MQTGRNLRLLAAAFAASLVLAGCGGGGGTEPPRASIAKVTVAGDSLADVGTFGARFTVQNSADANSPFRVYPEIIGLTYGISGQCNFFVATSPGSSTTPPTFTTNSKAGCTNFAVGGGRINVTSPLQGPQQSIPLQLQTAATAAGSYSASDLLVIDGGGNDAGDVVQAYLGLATGQITATTYAQFLSTLVDPTTVGTLMAQGNTGVAQATGLYFQKLADKYYDAIKGTALDKGASHVAVLNMPDITVTPNFTAAKTAVSNANGGGTAGATAAANFQGLVRQWISGFNIELSGRVGGDSRIALVDFYSDLNDEVSNPANYGLTEVVKPACVTALGVNAGASCTSAALDAAPPAGMTAGWWQTWAFADGLHPTPFGQQLLSASVSRAIARAGWI